MKKELIVITLKLIIIVALIILIGTGCASTKLTEKEKEIAAHNKTAHRLPNHSR